jgi:O-acetyl-ADP-ribose deacetylase
MEKAFMSVVEKVNKMKGHDVDRLFPPKGTTTPGIGVTVKNLLKHGNIIPGFWFTSLSDEHFIFKKGIIMEKSISGVKIELTQGNIAAQPDMTAIVNAANAQLRTGGGVAGAIHMAAGPGLEVECRPLAPIKPGQAVITGAHRLPNEYIIHCLGPVYGHDKPENKLLANCYRNVLRLANKNEIESIAFPSISTGAFGYPVEDAAKVALSAIMEAIPKLHHVKTIRIVLFSESDLHVYRELLPPAGL